jgi:acyl-CoA thioester hydrolase
LISCSVDVPIRKLKMHTTGFVHEMTLRVRYSETDQMGTFYNSRVLEWFECARTELLRAAGVAYADVEKRGILLPVVEAHVKYEGRARYDDLLHLRSVGTVVGKASLRVDVKVVHADGRPVATGYTIHAVTSSDGRPTRTPSWLAQAFGPSPDENKAGR